MVIEYIFPNNLKPHQLEELKKIINQFENGDRRILLEGETGIGKTRIAIEFIKYLKSKQKNLKVLIVIHRKALAFNPWKQELEKWYKEEIEGNKFMIISGEFSLKERKICYKEIPKKDIIIILIQTLNNDLSQKIIDLNQFDLFIFDEAHNVVAQGEELGKYRYSVYYKKTTINLLLKKDAVVLGLTIPNTRRTKITEKKLKASRIVAKARGPKTKTGTIRIHSNSAIILDKIFSKALNTLNDRLKEILENKLAWKINEDRFKEIMQEKGLESTEQEKYLQIYHIYKKLFQARLCIWEGVFTRYTEEVINYLSRFSNKSYEFIFKLFKDVKNEKEEHIINLIKKLINENKKVMIYCKYKNTVYRIAEILRREFPKNKILTFVGGDPPYRIKEIQMHADIAIFSPVAKEGLDLPQFDALIFVSGIAEDFVRKQIAGRIRGGEVYYVVFAGTNDEKKLSQDIPEAEVVIDKTLEYVELPIVKISGDLGEATYEISTKEENHPSNIIEVPTSLIKNPTELSTTHIGKFGETITQHHLETHGIQSFLLRKIARRKKRYLKNIGFNEEQINFIKENFKVIPEPAIDLIAIKNSKPVLIEVKTSLKDYNLRLEKQQIDILNKAVNAGFDIMLATVKIEFNNNKIICGVKLWVPK